GFRYQEGGSNSMTSRVPDCDSQVVLAFYRQRHEVEVVATDLVGEEHSCGDLETRHGRHDLGQKSFLNLACQTAVVIVFLHFPFCVLTLDELTDLAPNAGHHLDKIFVRLPNLPADKLHDAKKPDAISERETDSLMQPHLCRKHPAREVGVFRHVGNPYHAVSTPQ